MRLFISPAKQMVCDGDWLAPRQLPQLLPEAEQLADYLRALSLSELQTLLRVSAPLARQSYAFYHPFRPREAVTPAILAYQGIQYRYMAPDLFSESALAYIERRLFILSGLYGVLRPLDAVVPHRLEMQTKLRADFCKTLYDYWGDKLARIIARPGEVLLNLASAEYAKAVLPYLPPDVRCITPVFGELSGERIVSKGVHVKMARGEMVRFLAERGAETPSELLAFDRLGYRLCPERSTADAPVFLREPRAAYRRI